VHSIRISGFGISSGVILPVLLFTYQVEIVANTYVVSAGLPHDDPQHALLLACFAADLLDVCSGEIPGIGPVKVRVGINSGPVTAGLIGCTRRFYRVFGDTGEHRYGVFLAAGSLSAFSVVFCT
jgi:hypothetical protein